MPLVVITGYPCSGKSSIAEQIYQHALELSSLNSFSVILLKDTKAGFNCNAPLNTSLEKNIRSSLLSDTERHLDKQTLVIVDASHEIKGWRYQMHCLSRAVNTIYCVVYCATPKNTCIEWNESRKQNHKDHYSQDILNQLFHRFEFPNPKNRWDSPLITISPLDIRFDDVFTHICSNTIQKQKSGPSIATQPKPIAIDPKILSIIDTVTNTVLQHIYKTQEASITRPASWIISSQDWPAKLNIHQPLSIVEGQRLKKQFLSLYKQKPIDGNEIVIMNAFVEYLASILNS